MGTDIHCFAEEKVYENEGVNRIGKWVSCDKWTSSWAGVVPDIDVPPIWEVLRKDMVFTDRNYKLFAILANHRNSENMPYI